MQSSPVSNVQRSISTSLQDSGSHPSLLGPWLEIDTANGHVRREHLVEFPHRRVDDRHVFDEDVLAEIGLNEVRPEVMPMPKTRSATGTPREAMSMRRVRSAT